MEAPGTLLASGRDADIFEYGASCVLRRSRQGRSQVQEARTMEFVRAQGYPVPEVLEVSDDGTAMVMSRVDGVTMIEAASSQPWKLRGFGHELAALHEALHAFRAPEWMTPAPCGSGDRVLHMDLHPLNVMMSSKGPVVLDWTNAVRGDPFVDVATTWVLLAAGNVASARMEALKVNVGRHVLLKAFLKPFAKSELHPVLRDVVAWKSQDPHMSALEVGRMHSLLEGASRLR